MTHLSRTAREAVGALASAPLDRPAAAEIRDTIRSDASSQRSSGGSSSSTAAAARKAKT